MVSSEKDSKTILQELYQAKKQPIPIYSLIEISGPNHNQKFKVEIKTYDKKILTSIGPNRRQAEKNAASELISKYFPLKLNSGKSNLESSFDYKKIPNFKLNAANKDETEKLLIELSLPS